MARVKFGDVVKEVKNNIDRTNDDHEYFIAGEHMDSENIHLTRKGKFSESDVGPAFIRLFKPGQILYGSRRTYLKKVAVADFEGITSNTTFVLESKNESILLQGLLPFLMLSDSFTDYAVKHSKGSTNPYILFSDLAKYEFELPDIERQKTLLAYLQHCDKLREAYKELLIATDNLVKSQFIEMFGDPMLNPKSWPVHQLSKYIEFLTSGSRGWAKYFTDDGEYFITIKNVKDCRITLDNMQHITPPDNAEAKRTKIQTGDLLISITADLGRTGVVSEEIAEHGAYINQHLTCIRLNQNVLDPLYTAYYMESEAGKSQFESKNQSAVKAGLNFNSINSLRVMIPPLERQKVFVQFVEQTDKSK